MAGNIDVQVKRETKMAILLQLFVLLYRKESVLSIKYIIQYIFEGSDKRDCLLKGLSMKIWRMMVVQTYSNAIRSKSEKEESFYKEKKKE